MKIDYFLFPLKSMSVFCVLNLKKGHIKLPAMSGRMGNIILITMLQGNSKIYFAAYVAYS